MYAFPNERRVRLWDFPGAGTKLFPRETYIAKMGLRYLDRVIIVTAGRYTETEIDLMKELRAFSVPHVMVRTKIDIDLWNNRVDNGLTEQTTLGLILKDVQDNSKVARPYLVSLRDTSLHDFPELLRNVFPCLHQPALGGGWDDAWALPVVQSQTICAIQGRWTDGDCVYTVQNLEVHVARNGNSATVSLGVDGGKVWWRARWWISEEQAAKARATSELRWAPVSLTGLVAGKPLIWRWCD